MAKLFIALLGALVILNALTFLVLVSQEPVPGDRPRQPAAESPEAADQRAQQIGSLEIAIRSLKTTLDNLSRKVDELPKKVAAAVPNPAPAARAPSVAPARGGVPAAGPAARTHPDLGTTIPEEGAEDFLEESAPSRAPPPAGEGGAPSGTEGAVSPAPPEEE